MKQICYGKGILTAKIAVSQAISAQRQLEYGEDFKGASIRLNLSKRAFHLAEGIAKNAKVMASLQELTQRGDSQEIGGELMKADLRPTSLFAPGHQPEPPGH